MAGQYNIVRRKGDTFNLSMTVETSGVAWNFTSYTAKFQVRRSSQSATTLLSLTDTDGITLDSSGNVTITASSADMDLPVGRWVYDFEVTSSGGEKTTLLAGRFIVEAEVTY
jgi:hypothetical protein